jgi:predicted choloylglycine hydrolase
MRHLGHCIEVKWLKYDAAGVLELEYTKEQFDAGVQRRTSIYKEYNPEICKKIIELTLSG